MHEFINKFGVLSCCMFEVVPSVLAHTSSPRTVCKLGSADSPFPVIRQLHLESFRLSFLLLSGLLSHKQGNKESK